MANLKTLRVKIASLRNTAKITSAMKMISATKMRRSQDAVVQSRAYAEALKEMLDKALASSPSKLAIAQPREVKKALILVVSSDKGLCGAFNGNVIKAAVKRYEQLRTQGIEVSIECAGKKCYDYLRRHEYPVQKFYDSLMRDPQYQSVETIGLHYQNLFISEAYDQVEIVYNEFRSTLSQVAVVDHLLPLKIDQTENSDDDILFDPSRSEIVEPLLSRAFYFNLYRRILQSAAGEHAARMTAMDSATKNAQELINQTTLNLNKVRQASITTELTEIVSGAGALSN